MNNTYKEIEGYKILVFPSMNDNFKDAMVELNRVYGSTYTNENNEMYFLDKYNYDKGYPYNTIPKYYLFKDFYIDRDYQLIPYSQFSQLSSYCSKLLELSVSLGFSALFL